MKHIDRFRVTMRDPWHHYITVFIYPNNAALNEAVLAYDKKNEIQGVPEPLAGCTHRYTRYNLADNTDIHPDCGIMRLSKEHLGSGVISHECAHMALHIWEIHKGLEALRSDDDEQFAYILGDMMRKIVGHLNNKKFYES